MESDKQSIIIKQEQEAPVEPKKRYTPPTLIVYGKLIQLTAGGPSGSNEGSHSSNMAKHP
jgi:hypothetical protein